jgi:hypothetical protein
MGTECGPIGSLQTDYREWAECGVEGKKKPFSGLTRPVYFVCQVTILIIGATQSKSDLPKRIVL